MGNRITITQKQLIVVPTGFDKLWSLKAKLAFPLSQVVGATADQSFIEEPKGVRFPGLATLNKWSGTFIHNGQKSFYNVTTHQQVLVIQLKNSSYHRLVLGVTDAVTLSDKINSTIEKVSTPVKTLTI